MNVDGKGNRVPDLPAPPVPEGHTERSWLRRLCEDGLLSRYGAAAQTAGELVSARPDVAERYRVEAQVVLANGFTRYFLIVAEYVEWARNQGITISPGRGPAAGSIICYALGITQVDPLAHGLLFERFINPECPEFPDIDIDFENERRGEVLAHLVELYGDDRIAHIGMVGVAGGMRRGIHACGIAMCEAPLEERTPLWIDERTGKTATAFDALQLKQLGVAKLDLMGLRSLDIVAKACRSVRRSRGQVIEPAEIPCDDELAFALLRGGNPCDYDGLFQVEMSLFASFYQRLPCLRFADIVASIGLMRPAPLQDGLADEYHARACGRNAADFYDGRLAPILEETYGLIIYQEQLMSIAKVMCGFTAGQADDLRVALLSGGGESARTLHDEWVAGAVANGYDERVSQRIWDDSTPRAKDLLFCKAHGAAYATLVMWTAYLKVRFPVEFAAAVHTSRVDDGLHAMKSVDGLHEGGPVIRGQNTCDANGRPCNVAVGKGPA